MMATALIAGAVRRSSSCGSRCGGAASPLMIQQLLLSNQQERGAAAVAGRAVYEPPRSRRWMTQYDTVGFGYDGNRATMALSSSSPSSPSSSSHGTAPFSTSSSVVRYCDGGGDGGGGDGGDGLTWSDMFPAAVSGAAPLLASVFGGSDAYGGGAAFQRGHGYDVFAQPHDVLKLIRGDSGGDGDGSPPPSSCVVLDCTWDMPAAERDIAAEFAALRLPTAQRFDIDAVSDVSSDLPHMLPTPARFQDALRALGVDDDDDGDDDDDDTQRIVVYDRSGENYIASARVWWTLRYFGVPSERIRVLAGGLPAWQAAALPTSSGADAVHSPQRRGTFTIREDAIRHDLVVSGDDLARIVRSRAPSSSLQIVDARSRDRFAARAGEPRAGLVSGRIVGSKNLPSTELFSDELTRWSVGSVFRHSGVDVHAQPTVALCGSGVTACVLALGFYAEGNESVAVYDGSWSEAGRMEGDIAAVISTDVLSVADEKKLRQQQPPEE